MSESIIPLLAAALVVIMQAFFAARSQARIAELKASAVKNEATLGEVHELTNRNFSEQKAEIAKQAEELKILRATISKLEAMMSEQFRASQKPKRDA